MERECAFSIFNKAEGDGPAGFRSVFIMVK